MKRAVIYARVSTKRQADDGLPVESQVAHCREKAAALKANVARVFIDGGVSGSTDRRPAFQDALNYCAVMEVDYFITWASSRFARNHLDAGHYKGMLERYGTRLIYSSTDVDIRTDDGWFIDALGSVIDERYSRQVASDTRRSMLKAARDGFFLGGRVPFGYVAVPEGKRKRLAVHPTEGATVRQIFASALRGMGAKMLALQLNGAGLTLRGQPWAKNTVAYILRNEVYAGRTVFNRTSRGGRENPPEDWVRVQSHEALVAGEDFDRVGATMKDRQPMNVGGQPRSHFAFVGLLKCGLCGSSLQTSSGTGRSKVYHYYGCRGHLSGKNRCTLKRVRADLWDEWMLAELLDQVMKPERMAGIIEEAKLHRLDQAKERANQRAAIVSELRVAERARTNLYGVLELHGQDAPNLKDLTPRLRTLNERVKALEAQLIAMENAPLSTDSDLDLNPEEVAQALRGIVLECQDAKKVRAFLGTFVKEITVGESEVVVDYLPECLVRADAHTRVHSGDIWLPELGTLRTARIRIERADLRLRLVA